MCNQIIITRNIALDRFCIVNKNGSHTPLDYKGDMKAGDIARLMARANPDSQIGILTETFETTGNWRNSAVRREYGEVVWMKPGFELN